MKKHRKSLFLGAAASLMLLGAAVWAFIWAVRKGQFDDLETPAVRVLFDDEEPVAPRRGQGAAASTTGVHE